MENAQQKTARIQIAVPDRPRPDLVPLIKALGDAFQVQTWNVSQPLAENLTGPVLVDLRSPEQIETARMSASPTRELIVVADAAAAKQVEAVPAKVLGLLSPDWPPSFAVTTIRALLKGWRAMQETVDEYENIIEIQQEVVKQAGDIIRLKEQLAERTLEVEERNIELTLKNHELSRLNVFKEGVLKQIGDPDTGYVAEVLRQAEKIAVSLDASSEVRATADRLHQTAKKIEHVFRPYDFYAKAETALSGRSILVVVRDRPTRNLLVRSLLGTGARIQGVEAVEEGIGMLHTMRPDILYSDWDSAPIINEAQKLRPAPQAVLMTSQPVFELYGKDMLDLPLSNLLIMKELGSQHDPLVIQELVVTAGKLLSGEIFGLEKYLAWGTAIREELVTGSAHAREIIKTIDDYLTQASYRGSIKNNFCVLADELISNAVWDAPANEKGEPKYLALRRTGSIELDPNERPVVRFGSDGNLLGISVSDPFGRLERDHVRRYLVKCFAKGADQIDRKPGGAGLGLYMSLLAVSTLVINVAPKRRTEVIGLINVHPVKRDSTGKQRSFMYFRA